MPITTTARGTPEGRRLGDGHSTKIAFSANATIGIWEKAVQPPGADGGPKIDITTMHNTEYEQFAAQALKQMTDGSIRCLYDPAAWDDLMDLINVEQAITCHYPNGATLDFYGYMQRFVKAPLVKGQPPEADVTFVCTNTDPETGAEAGPNYKTPSGTD